MHWGHARTKDFLTWEELPVALTPGLSYDGGGCWSIPREIVVENGHICGRPAKEVAHLLQDSDPCVTVTENSFTVERTARPSLVHKGDVKKFEILKDEYILEIFVNGGETVYSLLLC